MACGFAIATIGAAVACKAEGSGAGVADGATVGAAVGFGGAIVGRTVGAAVGFGGASVGAAVGTAVGFGIGAAVGGTFTLTEVTEAGTLVGTAATRGAAVTLICGACVTAGTGCTVLTGAG